MTLKNILYFMQPPIKQIVILFNMCNFVTWYKYIIKLT
jgi:hypothetical protein